MGGRMEEKKAIVVGSGQPTHERMGNGRAMALAFAHEGAVVCCVDREQDRAEETVELIRAAGGHAHALRADISVPEDCARLVEEAHALMGPVNVLVNNVGSSQNDADPMDLTVEAWQGIVDINMRGTWLTSRAVVPIMRDAGGGSIINTSSVGSRAKGGNLFAYSVSKAGVNAITGFFAVQYAARQHPVQRHPPLLDLDAALLRRFGSCWCRLERGGDRRVRQAAGAARIHGSGRRHWKCRAVPRLRRVTLRDRPRATRRRRCPVLRWPVLGPTGIVALCVEPSRGERRLGGPLARCVGDATPAPTRGGVHWRRLLRLCLDRPTRG